MSGPNGDSVSGDPRSEPDTQDLPLNPPPTGTTGLAIALPNRPSPPPGLDLASIMQAGKWKSPTMVARYPEKLAADRGAVAMLPED